MNQPPTAPPSGGEYRPEEAFALDRDARDPLASFRDRFHLPESGDGKPPLYFCGNSLGLQPKSAREEIERELNDWARLGVRGHFQAGTPWFEYHRILRDSCARLAGALPDEVVVMNSLTVNLHLMMTTFYRPTEKRHKILLEAHPFPSDIYAVESQIRHHGYEPATSILLVGSGEEESSPATEDFEALLDERGDEIAVVLLGAVQYLTGQAFDVRRIAAAARRRGCRVGLDLAHAIGNVPLSLHDDQIDFAVWCSYKYLNGGPGAPGGCFVHERHGRNPSLPRLAGWWGNDPAIRFRMEAGFVPQRGADGWQVSNPPILAMAPLRAALAIFDDAGIDNLRAKSLALTGYLEYLLDRIGPSRLSIVTPRDPAARGCQLSIRFVGGAIAGLRALAEHGVVADVREPDVIRVAPVPLYNRFHEVWRLGRILDHLAAATPERS